MNEDLILRARVHELGEDVLEKKIGSFGRGAEGASRFIPFFGQKLERRGLAMSDSQYKQQMRDLQTQERQLKTQKRRGALAERGLNTRNVSNISPTGKTQQRLDEAQADTEALTDVVETNPVMNQQQPQQGTQTPQMPDTSQQFGGGQGQGNVTDPNQQQDGANPTINPPSSRNGSTISNGSRHKHFGSRQERKRNVASQSRWKHEKRRTISREYCSWSSNRRYFKFDRGRDAINQKSRSRSTQPEIQSSTRPYEHASNGC